MTCEDCEGSGSGRDGLRCFKCDGSGELCDDCGESLTACTCEDESLG